MNFDPALPDDRINVSSTHPLREALVLVAWIAGTGAALVVGVTLALEWALPRIPPGFEARLFAHASEAAALGSEVKGARDPRAERVEHLLERLARHWPDRPYDLRTAIWQEATPNALAFPGGSILVTSGLLDQVASENELAFVLAHEIGHFRNRDHLRGLGRGVAVALVLGALGWSGSGGAAQLAAISGGLAARGFDRDQEADADRFGLALVQAEYGHVAGTWDFFGRLPDPATGVPKQLAHYLATHPLNENRIAALRALAQERNWSTSGDLVPLNFAEPAKRGAGPATSTALE